MSNNLCEACLVAEEQWFGSMELIEGEHQFSKPFEKKMNRLLDKMRNDKYHRLTRRAVRAIIIAAILLALATTAIASPRTREYIVERFSDHSAYAVEEGYVGEIDDLSVGYIPDGYEQTYSNIDKENSIIAYEYSNDDLHFSINKMNSTGIMTYDTEYDNSETIIINGIEYIYYKDDDGFNGLLWNYTNNQYLINGNIDKELLIKIAENLK